MDGALFGAYALTHAVQAGAAPPRSPLGTRPSGRAISPQTSRNPLRAG
jgi:hypothetical protein